MEAIATLPVVLAVVLCELAVGGALLAWLIDRSGEAPAGFLKLVAAVDAVALALAAALVPTLPRGELAQRAGLATGMVSSFGQVVVILALVGGVALVFAFTPWRQARMATALVLAIAGGATLVLAAATRTSTAELGLDPLALAALPFGAVTLGGSNGAMLLGHWYLVTPKLSPRPLQRAALVVVAGVVLQAAVAALSVARGDLVGITQTALWVAVALRFGVGLAMTLAIALAAWWTARMNTQSSTGLLYVGLGTVLAGEISARVIFFLTGAAI